ncbi:anti-sigma factor [Acidiphilium sp.]|uniref:anti-sigma factor n=1 Tax=Acidiphilium sp. TaxID=527 RepID=UPI003CFFB52C
MSGSMADDGPDRAGLYVLGLLRGAERREFEAACARDPALAAEVAAWEERLLPLALAVPPVAPGPAVWAAIERATSPRAAAPARRNRLREIWDNLFVWRGIALAGAVAAALLLVLPRGAPGPAMVAVLSAKLGPVFTVAMKTNGALNIAPVGHAAPPAGKVWQLWAVGQGEAPVPIGFVQAGATRLPANDVPARLRRAHTLIAVTVEPPGGSPTGKPDMPIVFAGPLLPVAPTAS